MKLYDWSRKDKCEPTDGTLFSGGYALVTGGAVEFLGKMMLLVSLDEHGFWECFDSAGDMLILAASTLMPVSEEGWDNSTELDKFIYEVRYVA